MQTTNNYNRDRYRLGVWFTAPAVIVLLVVLAYPILASLALSFLRVRFGGYGLSFEFNGIANYADLFTKPIVREALFPSVYFTVVEVIAVLVLALIVALMLNHPLGRHAFFRIVLLVPWALSPVANAVLWKWIYNANYGILNQALIGLGIIQENIIWLGKPWLALNMILLADVWTYPERIGTPLPRLDLAALGRLDFFRPEPERYPALALAGEALAAGGSAPAVLNAANEVAVEAFLAGRIPFPAIIESTARVLGRHAAAPLGSVEEALEMDGWARRTACEILPAFERPSPAGSAGAIRA